MSVTNDPNYHEGQPVFGPTDAVRPTGETGATCPWCGSERRVGNAPAAGYFIAPCENLECPEMQVYETEEAALAAASRPLPDFPAGAPGPWSGGIYGNGSLAIVDSRGQIVLDLSASESIESSDEREVRDFILSRVNAAPARPAAAGLTLSDEEKTQCVRAAVQAAGEVCGPSSAINPLAYAAREAIAQVQRLLSSRATGAEVEIVIPEPIDDEITAFAMSSETGYGNMSHWFNHRWFRAGIEYARRHATMRTGGGE